MRAGNVIAFGNGNRKGREAMVVVAETKADDLAPVRDAVATIVRDTVGIPPMEIVFVRPGSLPKTSSGKLQRIVVPPALPGRRARPRLISVDERG